MLDFGLWIQDHCNLFAGKKKKISNKTTFLLLIIMIKQVPFF